MRRPELIQLARELEAIGAAPPVIHRTLQELADHLEDAEAAALAEGRSRAEARHEAARAIGSIDGIVAAVAGRPSLLGWRRRWPQTARCVNSASYCLLWPAAPFVYCANHPAGLVRWGLSSSLAACVTASILLILHWLVRSTTGL